MLGTVEPRKNIALACRAFGRFAAEYPKSHLVIAGKTGWKARASLAAIETLSTQFPGRVHRLEYVDESTKWALLKDASVLLMTSHAEGFGRPVIEAMSMGTPVIATATSAMNEIASDAAILVPEGDEQKITHALWRAIYHPTLPSKLVELGRQRAASFSIATMVDTILKTIERR